MEAMIHDIGQHSFQQAHMYDDSEEFLYHIYGFLGSQTIQKYGNKTMEC